MSQLCYILKNHFSLPQNPLIPKNQHPIPPPYMWNADFVKFTDLMGNNNKYL